MDETQAKLSLYTSLCFELLEKLSDAELDILADRFKGMASGLRDLADRRGEQSVIHTAHIDEYERIEFILRHREELIKRNEPRFQQAYFLCRKCDLIIWVKSIEEASCPVCKTRKWLEMAIV